MFSKIGLLVGSLSLLCTLAPLAQAKHHTTAKEGYEKFVTEDVVEAIKDRDLDDFKDALDDSTDEFIENISEDEFEKIQDYYYRENWKKGYEERKQKRAMEYKEMKIKEGHHDHSH